MPSQWSGEREFEKALFSLKSKSNSKITAIAKLAVKNAKYYKSVVHMVEKYVKKTKPETRLIGAYVIDAIVRTSRGKLKTKDPFTERFSKKLETCFSILVDCPDEQLDSIARVVGVWAKRRIFSSEVISSVRTMILDQNPNVSGLDGEKAEATSEHKPFNKDQDDNDGGSKTEIPTESSKAPIEKRAELKFGRGLNSRSESRWQDSNRENGHETKEPKETPRFNQFPERGGILKNKSRELPRSNKQKDRGGFLPQGQRGREGFGSQGHGGHTNSSRQFPERDEHFNRGRGGSFNQGQVGSVNQGQSGSFNQGQGRSFNQGRGGSFNQGRGGNLNQGRGGSFNQRRGGSFNRGGGPLNQRRGNTFSAERGGSFSQRRGGMSFHQGRGGSLHQGRGGSFHQGRGGSFHQGRGGSSNQGRGGSFNQGRGGSLNNGRGGSGNYGQSSSFDRRQNNSFNQGQGGSFYQGNGDLSGRGRDQIRESRLGRHGRNEFMQGGHHDVGFNNGRSGPEEEHPNFGRGRAGFGTNKGREDFNRVGSQSGFGARGERHAEWSRQSTQNPKDRFNQNQFVTNINQDRKYRHEQAEHQQPAGRNPEGVQERHHLIHERRDNIQGQHLSPQPAQQTQNHYKPDLENHRSGGHSGNIEAKSEIPGSNAANPQENGNQPDPVPRMNQEQENMNQNPPNKHEDPHEEADDLLGMLDEDLEEEEKEPPAIRNPIANMPEDSNANVLPDPDLDDIVFDYDDDEDAGKRIAEQKQELEEQKQMLQANQFLGSLKSEQLKNKAARPDKGIAQGFGQKRTFDSIQMSSSSGDNVSGLHPERARALQMGQQNIGTKKRRSRFGPEINKPGDPSSGSFTPGSAYGRMSNHQQQRHIGNAPRGRLNDVRDPSSVQLGVQNTEQDHPRPSQIPRGFRRRPNQHPGWVVIKDQRQVPAGFQRVLSTTLWIGNLMVQPGTQMELENIFQDPGLDSVTVKRGMAFVRFNTRQAAERARSRSQGAPSLQATKIGWGKGQAIQADRFDRKSGEALVPGSVAQQFASGPPEDPPRDFNPRLR